MSTPVMVPMISPDGRSGDIPAERVNDALAAGFKGAVVMTSPDGQQGYVPHDRAQDAIKAGFKVGQPSAQDFADRGQNAEGFGKALGSDLVGMAKGSAKMMGPMAFIMAGKHIAEDAKNYVTTGKTLEQQDATQRRAKGYSAGYSNVAAPAGEAIGVNVPGMEGAADIGDSRGVLGHAAAVPTAIAIAGGMAKAGPKIAARIGESVPSLERAGGKFQDVMGAAKNNPVPMTDELSGALSRYQELVDRGGSRSVSVSKLFNRVTNPDAPPMTYGEARDFASNISRLSADESKRLNPQMKQQVGAIRVALNRAVGQSAESVGKGAQYQSAMKEYAKASQFNQVLGDALEQGKKAVPYVGTAYGLKKLSDALGK